MNNMITAIKVFQFTTLILAVLNYYKIQIDRKYLIRKIDRHLSIEMFAISNNKLEFPKYRKLFEF